MLINLVVNVEDCMAFGQGFQLMEIIKVDHSFVHQPKKIGHYDILMEN